jgi:hypothetical protein
MHSLINKLLRKRGIEDPKDLSPEEKATFESWQLVLNKEELTVDDIRKFCQGQIGVIEARWKDYDTPQIKKAEWIPIHTVYKALLTAIDSPKAARESLEIQLNQLLQ